MPALPEGAGQMSEPDNGRTHEPGLRELTADLDGMRELFNEKITSMQRLMDERDRLYKERDESRRTAVEDALSAAREQTQASFAASEKAIVKAEEAQKAYNASHNDLSRKLDEQNKATMPRSESMSRHEATGRILADLKQHLDQLSGVSSGGRSVIDASRSNLALGVSVLVGLLSLATLILVVIRTFIGR